jgi:hypothetical protein
MKYQRNTRSVCNKKTNMTISADDERYGLVSEELLLFVISNFKESDI